MSQSLLGFRLQSLKAGWAKSTSHTLTVVIEVAFTKEG